MEKVKPRLFVKPGCPWCHEAMEHLRLRSIEFEVLDVIANPERMNEMLKLSSQDKTPTMDWKGEVLADFGPDELEEFLDSHGVI